jgi:hypothetical protein
MSDGMRDIAKVGSINGTVLAVTMADAEVFLKVVLLSVTILYTIHKWWITAKRQSTDTTKWNKKNE